MNKLVYTLHMKNINFKLIAVFLMGMLMWSGKMTAQERAIIRGTITDAKDNGPIPGVSVAEVDKENRVITGTTTDMNGNYALKVVNTHDKILFSFIGYKSSVNDIGGQSTLNVALESDAVELSTVVIEGKSKVSNGMLNIDERDLTSSVSKISTKDLEGIQATSIDQALQGRLAGVDIASTSGDPGAGMSIRIRGTSSLTASSDPLIVIDNMPSDISVSSTFDFGSADEQAYSELLNIAPSDIKEITVLKDAAATAVWGSRASNGVLMITTKRGAKGKAKIGFNYKGSISNQPDAIPTLSGAQYKTLIREEYSNTNNMPLNTSNYREFADDPNDPYYYYNYGQNTNWVKAITQTGYSNDLSLSISGGGEKATYRASANYTNQQGTTLGTSYDRLTARVNLDYYVSKRIKFSTDLSYVYGDRQMNYVNSKTSTDLVRSTAYKKMPSMSIFEYDIYGNKTSKYFSPESNTQGSFPGTYNPVAMAKYGKNNQIANTVTPTFILRYEINPALTFTSNVGFTINNLKINKFLPQNATGVEVTSAYANLAGDSDDDVLNTTTISNLTFSPNLGEKHNLIAIARFETTSKTETYNSNATTNTASSYLDDPADISLTNSSQSDMSSYSTGYHHVATLLNAQYKFLDRYLINGSIRMDGSSKFGPSNRYGYFPSVSGRWRVSDESFLKGVKFINDFSLKASYGFSGNEPTNNFDYISNYVTSNYTYLGYASVAPSNLQLSNLKWEKVIQTDYGFVLQLFNNRLSIEGDLYRKRTKDMILDNLSISSISGFTTMDMNSGTMDNDGWEINFDASLIRTKDLTVRANLNIARNTNTIRDISPFYASESGSLSSNRSYYTKLVKGTPLGTFFGYRYKGVYKDADATIARDKGGNKIYDPLGNPIKMKFFANSNGYEFQPGDAKYEDINHDGSIDASDVVLLGDCNPRFTGGFGPTITYKNLSVMLYFHFRYGNDVINRARLDMERMYNLDNQSTAVLKRWHNEGDVTDMPRALYGYGYNSLGSDRFVEDGSFLRFKSLTVSYKVSKGVQKLGINSISAYFNIQNLYTWTKYKGQDPEITVKTTDSNPWGIAYDDSQTPPSKTITVGLDFQF
jgi:TonB-linked SusC/RagA family outer membrane protein